jgi:predicted DNA-binding antitoxin AbrB/MazE fold protein
VWRQCRRMYHNKFVLGLQRKKKKRPLVFGSIIHEIIEAHLEGKKWRKLLKKIDLKEGSMFRKEREMYGNLIQDIEDIMTDYFDYWEGSIKPIEHAGRNSEHEFRIELGEGLWFSGKIDAVVKAKKMKWLMEHKSFSRMPSEDDRWRSVQAAVYFRALEEMGFPRIDGVLWDYISSKPCNVPGELTATGRISQAKIDTLPSRVNRWIEDEGKKKKDFQKMLADAEANRRNRFIRVFSPIKARVVDNIWEDFVDTAKEIQDFHGTKKDQNIGRHCSWCDYQPLCKAEVTDSDLEWLIKREYVTEDLSHKRDDKDRTED